MKIKQIEKIIDELSNFHSVVEDLQLSQKLPKNIFLNTPDQCLRSLVQSEECFKDENIKFLPSLKIPEILTPEFSTTLVYSLVWPLFKTEKDNDKMKVQKWMKNCEATLLQLEVLIELIHVYKKVKKFAKTNPEHVFNMPLGYSCVLGTLYFQDFPHTSPSWEDIRKAYFSSIQLKSESNNALVRKISTVFYSKHFPLDYVGIKDWLQKCESVIQDLSLNLYKGKVKNEA